jgi:uncharacterized membrane protein
VAVIDSSTDAAFFVILWVAFLGLLAWGSVCAIRGRRRQASLDPKQILKERLALGEIDPEDYERLRELIDSDDTRHFTSS